MNHKNYLLILICCLLIPLNSWSYSMDKFSYTSIASDTTTLFTTDQNIESGDYICIPIRVKNFVNISGFQFALQWNSEYLQFGSIEYKEIDDIAINSSLTDNGEMRLSWFDSKVSPTTLMDDDILIELCFTAMGSNDIVTQLHITSLEGFPIEIIAEDVIDYKIETGDITITNLLDCFMVPICTESIVIDFSPEIKIVAQDIIENLDYFLACYRLTIDDIYIINMSQVGAEISKSITFNCGDLHAPTTLGLAVLNPLTANPVSIYTLLCKTTIYWNIPDDYENCITNELSCFDPIRCKRIEIELDSTITTIYYDQLVDSTFDPCDLEYASQYTSIALDGSIIQDGFQLTCAEYVDQLDVSIALIKSFTDGSKLVAFDWCTSEVVLTGQESICDAKEIPNGFTPITIINERQILLDLNAEALSTNGAHQFLIPSNKIIDGLNLLEISRNSPTLQNISTLDMIIMWNYIVSKNTPAPMAIAGDVDLSGSLSTKDLFLMRKTILGVETPIHIGKNFMIETKTDFSQFDMFDFTNDYQRYYFDGTTLDINEGLNFEVFQYGDVNNSISAFHKSNEHQIPSTLLIENQYIKKGETVQIPFKLASDQSILGLTFSLQSTELSILGINHEYTGDILQLHHLNDQRLNVSLLSPKKGIDFEAIIVVQAESDGYLFDMIWIDPEFITPEVVYQDMKTGLLEFSWQEAIITDHTEVCYYPNPTSDGLFLEIPDYYMGGQIGVYNLIGKLIHVETIQSRQHTLRLQELNTRGLLTIRVEKDEFHQAFRIAFNP